MGDAQEGLKEAIHLGMSVPSLLLLRTMLEQRVSSSYPEMLQSGVSASVLPESLPRSRQPWFQKMWAASRNSIGVSQKGSRERYLPVFFLKMKRKKTEETEKKGRKRKTKTERNGKKTEENGKKRKKREKSQKTEQTEENGKVGSDTVPATPFAKPRL